jgi:hydroxypyruvate reductase
MSFTILQAATFPCGLRETIDPALKVVGPFGFSVGATLTAGKAAEVRVLITMGTVATDTAVVDRLPNLGLICCYGTGYEGADVVAPVRRGIQVTHSPGAKAAAVADHAIALLLAASRRIVMAYRLVSLATGRRAQDRRSGSGVRG